MRTLDDILPQLSKLKPYLLNDTTLGYWHTCTSRSCQQSFNDTAYSMFGSLSLPFGLKITSDAFQERLDRVLALTLNTIGIADDIITHGENEIEYDACFMTA